MEPLVDPDWLTEHLGAPDLVVLDCTVRLSVGEDGVTVASGAADWLAAHIPGSRFADLTGPLADGTSPLRFAVPTPEAFRDAMASLGVGDDRQVVLYDDDRSMWAARVWWMLRWIGFDGAAILDGGLKAWRAAGGAVESGPAEPVAPGVLSCSPRPRLIADKKEVLASLGDGATCLIDALPEAVHRGDAAMYPRRGHIPGAPNVPATGLVDESGRFRPRDELEAMFPGDRSARTITYCGGGIAASTDAFVLTLLGFDDVALYAASLQEWATDLDTPMVRVRD